MTKSLNALIAALLVTVVASCAPPEASPEAGVAESEIVRAFSAGSFVIPMDTTHQDRGTLRAFGLVYALLRAGVPVHWAILPGKVQGGTDFTVTAPATLRNVEPGTAVGLPQAYRGGPFIIDSVDRAAALPVITAWLASDTVTVVHELTAGSFSADIARTLTAAPRIAVFADGNESIAFTDLNAAGITDSAGAVWGVSSVDLLTEAQIGGPSATVVNDGALFAADGTPAYCHLTSMHYNGTGLTASVVREVRAWLDVGPITHAFAECHALATFENDASGRFLTTLGVTTSDPAVSTPVVNLAPDNPFAQYDGPLSPDGGSVRSIALATGSVFRPFARTLVRGGGAGAEIMWMSGRLDGDPTNGQVTYLGGHDYSTNLPISANPLTNGVRLFLDSLFESDCARAVGQPIISVVKTAPAVSATGTFTYTLAWTNTGTAAATSAFLRDPLPPGTTFVSATGGGAPVAGVVTWNLGTVAPGATGSVTLTVNAVAEGSYRNTARMDYRVQLTARTTPSNTTTTLVDRGPPDTSFTTVEPNPTNDPTGEFVFASTEAGSTFECRVDAAAFAPCPASFTTAALADGPHTIEVRARDAAGNVDPTPATYTWVVDTRAPDTSFTTVEPNPTNDPTGEFVFASTETPATFECRIDAGAFAACPASFTTPALADGMHTIEVRARDAAGNVDPTPATYTWLVDTMTRVAIVVPAAGATTNAMPTFSGTGEPGATVTVSVDGVPIGMVVVSAGGTWSLAAPAALTMGAHTVRADARDAAGNTASDTRMFTVDGSTMVDIVAPADGTSVMTTTPTISGTGEAGARVVVSVDGAVIGTVIVTAGGTWSLPTTAALSEGPHTIDAVATDIAGNMASDSHRIVVDTTTFVEIIGPDRSGSTRPTITGRSEPGAMVEVSIDGTVIGTVTTDSEGNWSIVPTTPLANGTHPVRAVATDGAGHTATDDHDLVIDATLPLVDIVAPADMSTTREARPIISGTSTPGATVQLVIDGGAAVTVMANATGAWSYTPPADLSAGRHTVVASVTIGGATATDAHEFTVDTAAPEIVIVQPAEGSRTDQRRPAIRGTATPGASIEVFVDGVLIATATAAADGSWSVTPTSDLPLGAHTARAVATDTAGRTATDANAFEIVAPRVAITAPADGTTTANPRPRITGTADPGARVEVFVDGMSIGTVIADATGAWMIDVPADLRDGAHTIEARATSPGGATASATSTFRVDRMAGDDDDGDGIPNIIECPTMPCRDSDGDGIPDYLDPDDDNDGILTRDEAPGGVPRDTDGDGIPDHLDPDDDNDGIPTRNEAPGGVPRDTDGDGIPDHLDEDDDNDTILTRDEAPGGVPRDTDGDGIPDHLDEDDDNDGVPTRREREDSMRIGNDDVDRDGRVNWLDSDADGDGVPDGEDGTGDDDGNGIPNYLDPNIVGGLAGGALCGVAAPGTGSDAGRTWALLLIGLGIALARRRRNTARRSR